MRTLLPFAIVCLCCFVSLAVAGEEAPTDVKVPLHDGLGSAHIPITTSSELAQKYFDQGLRLHYGFWIAESRRSFEEAIRQDPDAPMPYWGKAWAYGAYHNNGAPMARDLETSYAAIQEALARKSKATPIEQDLIDAMAKRVCRGPGDATSRPRPRLRSGDEASRRAVLR